MNSPATFMRLLDAGRVARSIRGVRALGASNVRQ
jgi:hypothetical protein